MEILTVPAEKYLTRLIFWVVMPLLALIYQFYTAAAHLQPEWIINPLGMIAYLILIWVAGNNFKKHAIGDFFDFIALPNKITNPVKFRLKQLTNLYTVVVFIALFLACLALYWFALLVAFIAYWIFIYTLFEQIFGYEREYQMAVKEARDFGYRIARRNPPQYSIVIPTKKSFDGAYFLIKLWANEDKLQSKFLLVRQVNSDGYMVLISREGDANVGDILTKTQLGKHVYNYTAENSFHRELLEVVARKIHTYKLIT